MVAVEEVREILQEAISFGEEKEVPSYILDSAHRLLDAPEEDLRRGVAFLADIMVQLYALDYERNEQQEALEA